MSKETFQAWYGSTDARRKMAAASSYHTRTRALASLRQMGHDGMDYAEYTALHHAHLTQTMQDPSLSHRYAALVDPRITPEHLELALKQKYETNQGRIFQRSCQEKLDKLTQKVPDDK